MAKKRFSRQHPDNFNRRILQNQPRYLKARYSQESLKEWLYQVLSDHGFSPDSLGYQQRLDAQSHNARQAFERLVKNGNYADDVYLRRFCMCFGLTSHQIFYLYGLSDRNRHKHYPGQEHEEQSYTLPLL